VADLDITRADQEKSPSRLALTRAEAASALGVSVDFFDEHVMPEIRVVRRGRRRLVPLSELHRWLYESADRMREA
jgi:excisionase family DNA binding protein